MVRLAALLLTTLATACADGGGGGGGGAGDGGADSGADSGADGGSDSGGDGGAPCVATAGDSLPEGLTELSWDDGTGGASVVGQGWEVVEVALDATRLNQSVRFELAHPARVHGFSVQLGGLPAADLPVEIGLYPDFGYNGFDFWPDEAWWSGSRCSADLAEGAWATWALPTPVELSHPGLVYVVAQRAEGDPALLFDLSVAGDGSCALFDDCHSSMNLPDLTSYTSGGYAYSAWNGLSFSFQYDFLVRLHVEYTDDLDPAETVFQPVEGLSLSHRAAWGDYDGDGWDDLFSAGTLYRNTGAGFEDATTSSGIAALGLGSSGGVWGDFDNDGCLDLFSFAESHTVADALLRNDCAGGFTDWTASSGIVDAQDTNDCGGGESYDKSPTPAAAWVDLDQDGLLDLYLANFLCWTDYTYYSDTVWHNEGDGTFTDWSGAQGFSTARRAGRGVNPIDHDGDGDVDVLVNNYVLHANLFFENLGDGSFDEAGADWDLDGERTLYGGTYYYGHTIGTAWGDLDGDGDFDSVQANLAHPRYFDFSDQTQVLLQGDGVYSDVSGVAGPTGSAAGLRYQETYSVPVLGDIDHDGHLDLAISAVYDGRPTDFYWGNGDGSFQLDSYHAGITTENGWGMAMGDADNDGDLDLAASGALYLHQGHDGQGGALGHWLALRLVGDVLSNRAAIGATARVEAGGRVLLRAVSGGNGQGGQDSQTLHFGLGDAATVDAIEVDFPGGGTVRFEGPFAADQRLTLKESGAVE
jgi:hypothetical protein